MSLLSDTKIILRISADAFDTEITDLIEAAQEDLVISGVLQTKIDSFVLDPDTDYTLKRAVQTYVKAWFGWNNPNIDDFKDSYEMQKTRLTMVDDYITEVV